MTFRSRWRWFVRSVAVATAAAAFSGLARAADSPASSPEPAPAATAPAPAPAATTSSASKPATAPTPTSAAVNQGVAHGWVAVRDHAQQVTHLIHLPPRGVGDGRVELGTVRLVAGSPQPVDRLAVWSAGGGGGASSSDVAMILMDTPRGSRGGSAPPSGSSTQTSNPVTSKPGTTKPGTSAEPTAREVASDKPAASGSSSPPTTGLDARGNRLSRVLGIAATPMGPIGWDYPPGRPQVLASLPGEMDVVGAAGSPQGPVVLLRQVERFRVRPSDPGWSLRVLTQNQWRPVQLPWDVYPDALWWTESAHVYMVSWSDAVGILVCQDDTRNAELWIGRLAPIERGVSPTQSIEGQDAAREAAVLSATWELVQLQLPESFLIHDPPTSIDATWFKPDAKSESKPDPKPTRKPDLLLGVDEAGGGLGLGDSRRHLVALTWEVGGGQRVTAYALRASGPRALATLDGVARDAAATVVHRDGQNSGVALVWIEQSGVRRADGTRIGNTSQTAAPGPSANAPPSSFPSGPVSGPLAGPVSSRSGPATSRLVVREIGMSGELLYAGPARTGERRFGREAEFLAMLLLMVMVGVVLFVIRPDAPSKVALPESMELAGRGRRVAGAAIDYLLAAMLAALILGVPARSALLPLPLLNDDYDPRLLLLTLGLAWLHTTLFEALTGRSIGKTIAGTWVMNVQRADKVAPRPTFDAKGRSATDGDEDVTAERDSPAEKGSAAADTGIAMGRPSFWSCAVRNLVRWGMPVLGIFVFIDALGRHPGDLGGRTIVVQPKTVDEED